MPKGRQTFRRSDLMRAIKAAHDSAIKVARIDFKDGGFSIIPQDAPPEGDTDADEWKVV
jgi:hypothetical protein